MENDRKEGQPAEKPTTKLSQEEILSGLVKKLQSSVDAGFDAVNGRLDRQQSNIDTLGENYKAINERMLRGERRADEFEDWRARASERVRGESKTNLGQDAAIAHIVTRVDAVETDTKALKLESSENLQMMRTLVADVRKFATNPTVKLIATGLGSLIAGYLASRGFTVPR